MNTRPVRAFRVPSLSSGLARRTAPAAALVLLAALASPAALGAAGKSVTLNGFLDFRKGNIIVVDAQRV